MKVKFMSSGFSKEMRLLTNQGYIRFEDAVGNVQIVKPDGSLSKGRVWRSGNKITYSVNIADGRRIRSTSDHVYRTNDSDECQAIALKKRRLMPFTACVYPIDKEYLQLGFLQKTGDFITLLDEDWLSLNTESEDPTFRKLFKADNLPLGGKDVFLRGYNKKLIELGFKRSSYNQKELPDGFFDSWSLCKKRSFIRGYTSACSWPYTSPFIVLSTHSDVLATQLSLCLDECFGVHLEIEKGDIFTDILDGEVRAIRLYSINMCGHQDCHKFMEEIGFESSIHIQKVSEMLIKHSPLVADISNAETVDVYDFSEPEENWGVVEGFVVHDCRSCNL